MAAPPSLKKYAQRFWALGYSRVALVLAIVLCLLALISPMWSATRTAAGNGWFTSTYTWTTVTLEDFRGGTWQGTSTIPYTSQSFDAHALAGAVQASYLAIVAFVILLFIVLAVLSMPWGQSLPRLGLLILAILVVIVGLLALFYPVATVPNAAASDLGEPSITGFWGSATTGEWTSWGAGLGWYLVLVAVILGCVGAALPYLRHMRGAPEANPKAWHPSR